MLKSDRLLGDRAGPLFRPPDDTSQTLPRRQAAGRRSAGGKAIDQNIGFLEALL